MASTTQSKKIGAVTWIAIRAEYVASKGEAFEADVAHRIMGAALVPGKRTEEEWDALYSAAIEAEATMKEAFDFGE